MLLYGDIVTVHSYCAMLYCFLLEVLKHCTITNHTALYGWCMPKFPCYITIVVRYKQGVHCYGVALMFMPIFSFFENIGINMGLETKFFTTISSWYYHHKL